MTFIDDIRRRASAKRRRVVFPESSDVRVLEAALDLYEDRILHPILVIEPSDPRLGDTPAERLGVETVVSDEQGALRFAMSMVRSGDADGCVAGAVFTSADVLRAALTIVGKAPGIVTVSSAFYMVRRGAWGSAEEVLTFTDCAVVPSPTAQQLAEIAICAARDRRLIVGDEPRVALLSFSTHGSATSDSVQTVREAVRLIRELDPALRVDGELQADAALVPEVALRKAPGLVFEGGANVLVFPSLEAGNIAYKLVERLGGAEAIGPVLQGLARPVSDLSRGAQPHDIINVAAITALKCGE